MALVLKQLLKVCPAEFVDTRNKYDWTPLHILASNQEPNRVRPGMIASLCGANAKIDAAKKRGVTPLMCAVSTGHHGAADMLILQGAAVDLETDEGTTMWDMAWHNKEMRNWVASLGVGEGAGVSGTGRFFFLCVDSATSQ